MLQDTEEEKKHKNNSHRKSSFNINKVEGRLKEMFMDDRLMFIYSIGWNIYVAGMINDQHLTDISLDLAQVTFYSFSS